MRRIPAPTLKRPLDAALFLPWVPLLAFAACMALPSMGAAAPRTLTRQDDPVCVTGKHLSAIHGLKIGHLRVLAYRPPPEGGAPVAAVIPYQFDERAPNGNLVFTKGPRAVKDDDNGHFDDNDELCLLAADMGDQAPGPVPHAEGDVAIEVEATDPVNGAKAWVYVVSYKDKASRPKRSKVKYTSYDPATDTIKTRDYIIANRPGTGINERLAVRPSKGGNETFFMDRYKVRFHAILKLLGIRFGIDEETATPVQLAYKAGSIRLMILAQAKWTFFGGVEAKTKPAVSIYYPAHFFSKVSLDLPINFSSTTEEAILDIGPDFNRNAMGMTFYSERNTAGVPVDGQMGPAEKALDRGRFAWAAVSGPQGAFLNRLTPVKAGGYGEVWTLKYTDDITANDPPESEPGQIGRFSFNLDMTSFGSGAYGLVNAMFFPKAPFKPGDEKAYFLIMDQPLKVQSRLLP